MPVKCSNFPARNGSIPYSAGRIAVNRSAIATTSAISAALTMAPLDGASTLTSFSSLVMLGRREIARYLISGEQEAHRHQDGIRRERVLQIARARSPDAQRDQHRCKGQHLPDLHAHVEAQNIRH